MTIEGDKEGDILIIDPVEEILTLAKEMVEQGDLTADEFEQLKEIETAESEKIVTEEEKSADLRTLLRDMGIPQKVKLAMFGNATCRMLLILDSNRLVQEAVLKNPQIQEREVIDFARNANMSENVLRRIASSKIWMKNYTAKVNITTNPKTPSDIAIKWLKYLRQPELKRLASSKNISQVVSTSAKKRLIDIQRS